MPRRPILAAALTGFTQIPALALLAAGAPALPVALGALAFGVGMMFGNAVWESALQRHIHPDALSRVSAYDWFGSFAFAPGRPRDLGADRGRASASPGRCGSPGAVALVSTAALLCVRDVAPRAARRA